MTALAVKSNLTVSIGTLKAGLLLNMAKDYIKELVNWDIGIEIIEKPYHVIEESDVSYVLKDRKSFSNSSIW